MNIRIRFAKYGCMKFISHLDVMRFFQKAIRRAGIDVCYSGGFNPHQILSFAAPLGLSQTSEGEYMDMEVNSITSLKDVVTSLNETMPEGMHIISATLLPDHVLNQRKETSMSLVSASDYLIMLKDGYLPEADMASLKAKFREYVSADKIIITRKTKSGENEGDIAPFIFQYDVNGKRTAYCEEYERDFCIYLLLAAGSVNNLKPEALMEGFADHTGFKYDPNMFQTHRIDTYVDMALKQLSQAEIRELTANNSLPEKKLVSLSEYNRIEKVSFSKEE